MTLENGQDVQLHVMAELKPEVELVQTLLLQTEELTVQETALKLENATPRAAPVIIFKSPSRIGFPFFLEQMSNGTVTTLSCSTWKLE